MLSYVRAVLEAAEKAHSIATRDAVFAKMRQLGLDDFGEVLMLMPLADFPKLSQLLPAMASAEVQNAWAGYDGYPVVACI